MRPVVRGDYPKDEKDINIQFVKYAQARGELIKRMGEFCSYCEMHLDSSLAVEHVQPKKPDGALTEMEDRAMDWNNFLLACTNCNSTKGNTDVILEDYFWPDRDNTFHLFRYSEGGVIFPAIHLSDTEKLKANKTILLTGLDKRPLNNPEASDRRWQNRRETWDIAVRSKSRLAKNNCQEMREQILETATGHAYWSIWMTVFEDDPDMRCRFIDAFPGTDRTCFDSAKNYASVAGRGIKR